MLRRFASVLLLAAGLSCLAGLNLTTAAAPGTEAPPPALPTDTVAFVHVRVADLWASSAVANVLGQLRPEAAQRLSGELGGKLGLNAADVESFTFAILAQPDGRGAPVSPLAFVRVKKALDQKTILEKMLPGAKEQAIAGLFAQREGGAFTAVRFLSDRELAIGSQGALEFLPREGPAAEVRNGPLGAALKELPNHQVVAGAAPSRELKGMLQGQIFSGMRGPDIEVMAGFLPTFFSVEQALMTFDLAPNLKFSLQTTFDQEKQATRGMRMAHAGVMGAQLGCRIARMELSGAGRHSSDQRAFTQLPKLLEALEKGLDDAKVEQKGKVVEVSLDVKLPEGVLERALLEAALRVRGAAEGMQRANHLRQVLIAMHNHHSDYMKMPGDYCDAAGKPILSWRVAILPYLEQDNLFRQFKTDEPWDSPNNKPLIDKLPKVYQTQGARAEPGMTFIQAFKAAPKYNGLYAPMFRHGKQQMTLGQITAQDGTSNTLAVIEAAKPVIWTKPDDLEIDADIEDLAKPGPAIGPMQDEGSCWAAMGDGSVRRVETKLPDMQMHKRLLRQLIGVRDGENQDPSPILDGGVSGGDMKPFRVPEAPRAEMKIAIPQASAEARSQTPKPTSSTNRPPTEKPPG